MSSSGWFRLVEGSGFRVQGLGNQAEASNLCNEMNPKPENMKTTIKEEVLPTCDMTMIQTSSTERVASELA